MAGPKETKSPLVAAALAFDEELERYAKLSETLGRTPLDSERALERAAGVLDEIAQAEERLGGCAQELMRALNAARDRQQTQATAVAQQAKTVQDRSQELKDLLTKYEDLGREAISLNELALQVAELDRSEIPAAEGERLARLDELFSRMSALADQAQTTGDAAKQASFPELARRAHDLRQQLMSARNKVGLLTQRMLS